MHLAELQKVEAQLLEKGFKIIALSPDKPDRLKKNVEKHKLKYQLFSDPGLRAAIDFGVAYSVVQREYDALVGYGVDIEKESGETHRLLPVPAAFIIDQDGRVRFQYANPDYKVRVSAAQLLAEVNSLSTP